MSASKKGTPPRDSNEAIVKRLLKQLPHADPALSGKELDPPKPPTRPLGPRPAPPPPPPPNVAGAWGRALLSLVPAVAVPFWPYANACGLGLYGYLAIVAIVPFAGVWAARFSWRERAGIAHTLALLVTAWGIVLGAERVLPRVGYAQASATWRCAEPPASAPEIVPTTAPMLVTDTLLSMDGATPAAAPPGTTPEENR